MSRTLVHGVKNELQLHLIYLNPFLCVLAFHHRDAVRLWQMWIMIRC